MKKLLQHVELETKKLFALLLACHNYFFSKTIISFIIMVVFCTPNMRAQSVFQPPGGGVPGLPAPGDAPSPVGINAPVPTADFHVDGTVRFQNLPNTSGINRYLTIDLAGNLGWQNGMGVQTGSTFGQTLYWSGIDYVPTDFLYVDPFASGSGGVGIGLASTSLGGKLHLHEDNALANNNHLRFTTNTGGNALIGQGTDDNRFLFQQSHFSNMVFNISTLDHMVLTPLGNVGIGDRPGSLGITERLHLHQDDYTPSNYIRFTRGNSPPTTGARIGLRGGGTTPDANTLEIRQDMGSANMEFWTNDSTRMTIDNTGWVGIGTGAPIPGLTVDEESSAGSGTGWTIVSSIAVANPRFSVYHTSGGDIETNGSFYTEENVYIQSDRSLKTNVSELNDWKRIIDLQTYSYNYIGKESGRLSYGFMAQDVLEVLPELTSTWREKGAVNYIGFIPFLTRGLQEHEERLNTIENLKPNIVEAELKILELEKENKTLQNQNTQFTQKFGALEEENSDLKKRLAALEELVYNQHGNGEGFGQTGSLNNPATLEQNEPNPFTQETVIRYFLPEGSTNAKIEVKNTEGKVVGSFELSHTGQGNITLSAGTLAAGSYFYSLIINNSIVKTKKMVLLN